jgi:uncharacterized membrane protein
VVDPLELASDVTQTVAYYALPTLLWLFLFLVAWEDPEVARASGFGRRTFWLLLPVGVVAELGTVPFFAWDGDILAVNVAGGVVPVLLSVLFLYRVLGRRRPALSAFLGLLAAETAVLFALVVILPSGLVVGLAALAVIVAFPLGLWAAGGREAGTAAPSVAARILPIFALTSAILYATFLTTVAESGSGIESTFPFYLLAPIGGGFLAAVVAVRWMGNNGPAGLPVAYATTTFGVLLGADVLRQPPLYGAGGPVLYSIGGAGLGDLLYLSGLISAATAYVLYRLVRPRATAREPDSIGAEATPATPSGLLHRAQLLSGEGRTGRSVRTSADAARSAAEQARQLRGDPPARPDRPWEGVPVPPWIEADHENLEALAAGDPTDPRDADRAWVTANGILRAAADAGRPRYPSLLRRSAAFGIDLGITVAPALLLWAAIVRTTPGTITSLVNSVTFNASVFGYASYGFLYFALAEGLFGTTVGKYVLGLAVSDRAIQRPGPLSVLLRNIPKLLPLTVVGVAGALGMVVLIRGSITAGAAAAGGSAAPLHQAAQLLTIGGLVALGLGVCAAASWVAIYLSRERQRVGDYVAGTWVIFRAAPKAPAPPTAQPARSA